MGYDFFNAKNKRLTLLGMAGVGKTHLSKMLSNDGEWFHYSGDYRIGSRYLNENILDNIKKNMMSNPFLKDLLKSDSIYIGNNISFDNLRPISTFLGRLGNPELGAIPLDEFIKRQALHAKAEKNAMLDVPDFIARALNIYGYSHFINDAGGSLCELDESVVKNLAQHTLLVYIRTSDKHQKLLTERAIKHPKPMYYHPDFLEKHLKDYLNENRLDYIAQVNPDHLSQWLFPKLLAYRLPKYEFLTQKYGVTIASDDLFSCQTKEDFFALLQ